MGQPVKIVDLAERMIRLSGLEPGRDIDITFTGIRPGERRGRRRRRHLSRHDVFDAQSGNAGDQSAPPLVIDFRTIQVRPKDRPTLPPARS
jgi:hypothetical protein